jgi:hypothetical protein
MGLIDVRQRLRDEKVTHIKTGYTTRITVITVITVTVYDYGDSLLNTLNYWRIQD